MDKIDIAVNHYSGKHGYAKKNCAQAVLLAFKDELGVTDRMVADFAAFGGGRAPGNECGAVYAAKVLMEKMDEEAGKESLRAYFVEHAGSESCREIRHAKRMSCSACVQNSARLVEIHLTERIGATTDEKTEKTV